jgi:hypothetical protein
MRKLTNTLSPSPKSKIFGLGLQRSPRTRTRTSEKLCFQHIAPLHAPLPSSSRQPGPATLPGSLARQPCPAALPGSLARQPCPAALPGSLARQPCPAVGMFFMGSKFVQKYMTDNRQHTNYKLQT